MKAVVVNYGVGNLFSIVSSLRRVGFDVDVKDSFNTIQRGYDLIVFPGVGTFKAVARYLRERADVFEDIRSRGVYFLGICLGMQIMFEYGFEGGLHSGLGWFKGYVDRLGTNLKLPHIGWSRIYAAENADKICEIFNDINGSYVYFIHSYAAYPADSTIVCMVSHYGTRFPALIARGNTVGTQFHPEKSGKVGLTFLATLYRWIRC
ncbi:MAG: imidazole glycerol phosphate synthase subunit HisH [Ignisphaera sp.]|nr:imidazole glycerol phosphate synthase subunit HisH [Ignisphaera sp.]MCX8167441.1 imidazole glycerol phosphate synthase subunit HisH [Ignisphaera sp.]MDW8084695.1 imidazole glycerol phosphate synthase subunit HisH [Ignisphaera sp.]